MSTTPPNPAPDAVAPAPPSSFTTRRRAREAREAAGEKPPERRQSVNQRAGIDAENSILVVTHVRQ